jgi:hypothetical protein
MQLSEAELLAIEKELCKRSLAEFAKRAWKVLEPAAQLKWGWALDAICLHLEAVTDGRITRLLMNVPPGSMKSLLTGVIWPAWEWGPRGMPEMRYIGTAHEEQLAIRDSRRCRDLIKSDWYQGLWQVQLSSDLDGKREFGNTRKGTRQARAFTSMTGVRGDRVILDDPISADNANSEAKLEAAQSIAFHRDAAHTGQLREVRHRRHHAAPERKGRFGCDQEHGLVVRPFVHPDALRPGAQVHDLHRLGRSSHAGRRTDVPRALRGSAGAGVGEDAGQLRNGRPAAAEPCASGWRHP